MKIINAFTEGWKKVVKSFWLWFLIYGLNIVFALVAAIPLNNLIEEKVGKSLEFKNMLAGFDYSVYSDFLNDFGVRAAYPTILNNSQVLVFCFFILSVFLTGGMLNVYKNWESRIDWKDFWSGCGHYFWRLLRLSIYFILIHIGIFMLFYYLLGALTKGFQIDELAHEGVFFDYVQLLIPIYLLVAAAFFMISDYAKIHVVHLDERWLFKPIMSSFKIGFNHFRKTYPLYLLNVLVFVFFLVIYWFSSERITASSSTGIMLLFVIGQIFVLSRIVVKLLKLASQTELYRNLMQ